MKHWAVVVVTALLAFGAVPADAREQRAWVKDVPDAATWKAYSKTVGSDELGKCIIDVKTGDIYFFDVNLFNIHADFVLGVLLKQSWTAEEDARLLELSRQGKRPLQISTSLRRSAKAIWTRKGKLERAAGRQT